MSNVKDVKNKGVEVTLSGEKHVLKYDLNSFAELEDLFGDIDEVMANAEKGKIKALRALLWGGLLHEFLDDDGNPTKKVHEVAALVTPEDLRGLFETMNKVMQESSVPDTAQGKGQKKQTKAKDTESESDPLA